MKIKIVGLASDEAKSHLIREFIEQAKVNLDGLEISDSLDTFDLALFAVTTGGVENKFRQIYEDYPEPYLLLYNEYNNSLPASMEILSFLNRQGKLGKLVDIKDLSIDNLKSIFPLFGERLGLVGKPSDWLIASTYQNATFRARFGMEIINIPIEEAINEYQVANVQEADYVARNLLQNASTCFNVGYEELLKASRFYVAMKGIVNKYGLNQVSVRCFDIITPLDTTGCIALALLNDEGIVSGCEGDLPSTLSMAILRKVSGKTPFMANVSYLKSYQNKLNLVLAHCTIGLTATKGYNLHTHFETDRGVGIEGFFEKGSVTMLRIGGAKLNSAAVITGEQTGIEFSPQRCRTQIGIETDEKWTNYFIERPLGNHHVVVSGDYEKELKKLLSSTSIEIVDPAGD